jgi:AAA domain
MSVNALIARLRGGPAQGALVVAQVAQWLGMPKPYGSKEPPVLTVITHDHGHDDHEALDVGTLLSEVTVAPVRWLWPGRIPLGKLTILDGDPGLGKSLITLDLIARITTGRGMPDELDTVLRELAWEPHGAVLLSAEDGLGDTIAPRLLAAGADLSLTLALQTAHKMDPLMGATYERGFLLPRDLETLSRAGAHAGAAGRD